MEGIPTAEKERRLAVDERLIQPGQRAEAVCGEVVVTPPAGEPHARQHVELGYLLRSHVAEGFLVALDMLTRTSERSDFAPDASVYPEARDPETGGRQLEVMAFEIVSEQRRSVATRKARELTERGVARVFCVDLNTNELLAWSTEGWVVMDEDASIEAACLHSPLPVRAILNAAEGDDAVVRALRQRGNPVILELERERYVEGRAEGRLEGREEGRLEGREEGRLEGREEGRLEGREEGQAEAELRSLVLLVEHQVGRPLSRSERDVLAAQLEALGHERLMKQVLDGSADIV